MDAGHFAPAGHASLACVCVEPVPNPDKYADELARRLLSIDDADVLYTEYANRGGLIGDRNSPQIL